LHETPDDYALKKPNQFWVVMSLITATFFGSFSCSLLLYVAKSGLTTLKRLLDFVFQNLCVADD